MPLNTCHRSNLVIRAIVACCAPLILAALASPAWAATFGKVVPIGGHAADLALDEGRGVLYVANYTANRIDVISLSGNSIQRAINVAPQPGALALSVDGRFLVIAHYGAFQSPNTQSNALTVIDLNTDKRQTFGLSAPPLGVAFGIDNRALVVTAAEFIVFDPVSGATQVVGRVSDIVQLQELPVAQPTFPPQIIRASVTATADALRIYGVAGTENAFVRFSYNVGKQRLLSLGTTSAPDLGPRVVSVSDDGSYFLAGWALIGCDFRLHGDCDASGPLVAQFPNASGALNIGSHAIDSAAGIVYAQIPENASSKTPANPNSGTMPAVSQAPVLMIMDADNLAIRERILLPENLAGRSVLNASRDTMYSVSDSGVLVLPVGQLSRAPRLSASQEDLVFRGSFCNRTVATQQLTIRDEGGSRIPFSLSTATPGIEISPASGTTPATVSVRLDPNAFQNQQGTVTAQIELRSAAAINLPAAVRVLINNREPDQRGTMINIPGKLVDMLADPIRDRFYVLRQDKNQVLVFDATSYRQVSVLRTSNTPTQMAITFDRKYLLVGHDNSQLAYVFDLDSLEPQPPIRFPMGHYPRSLASSGKAILAASRVAGPIHTIDRVDFMNRTAVPLPSLGVYKNDVHENTMLEAAPNGSAILGIMPDGRVLLYDAGVDSFTISRKDTTSLSGAYSASNVGLFAVGRQILNESLVPVATFESESAGFAFVNQIAFRTTAVKTDGTIQRMNLANGSAVLPTRLAEAPLNNAAPLSAFIRSLAPLANQAALVTLTTSGFTVLAWDYDAAVAPPQIERVVSAADQAQQMAPGGLISVFGRRLSPVNIATSEMPLPTALGESCLTVNGAPVPMLFVSATQINAQLPFYVDGRAAMVLRTPGGVSDTINLFVQPAAPGVFRTGAAGPETGIATIIRARNNQLVTVSNPLHPDDRITIYLTGMGKTAPYVEAGIPAPGDPLSAAVIQPTVMLGGLELPVSYAGLAPGEIGVYQINAIVPFHGVPLGFDVPLSIIQGGSSTTVPVRVVE